MTIPTQGEHAQTEALRLADDLEASSIFPGNMRSCNNAAAAELRRLHAQVAALTAATEVQAEPVKDEATCQMCGEKPYPGCNSEFQDEAACRFYHPATAQPAAPQGASNGKAPAGAASEPIAYLHDDGYWTPAKTEEGRKLNDRLHFAGSPKIGVHLVTPTAQAAPAAGAVAGPTSAHIAAMERAWLWMDNQADSQSKGGHATFDLLMLREERDALRAAIDMEVTATCPHCYGAGEVFGHAENCADDLCALNGDDHSCAGQVEPCQCAAAPTPAAQADSQPAPAEVADAMADSQYLAGVSAGWNAANADDPNAALQKLHESRAGYLKPLSAARAPADSVLEDAARYRWLRRPHLAAGHGSISVVLDDRANGNMSRTIWLDRLDAVIDAARKQGGL